jgi:hypothetical protein
MTDEADEIEFAEENLGVLHGDGRKEKVSIDKFRGKPEKMVNNLNFLLGLYDFWNEINDNNINVTAIMQYILCLDTLNLSYDKEKLLSDKDYRLSIIEKLYKKYGKSGKYKDWTILRYFWEYKSEDSQKILETEIYRRIRKDYEKQFQKEKQERENKELVPKLAVEVENKEEKITETIKNLPVGDIIKYLKFMRS